MDEPVTPEGFEKNNSTAILTAHWVEGNKLGLMYQDMENNESWLAMRDAPILRLWA
jgi:hypothetical protein